MTASLLSPPVATPQACCSSAVFAAGAARGHRKSVRQRACASAARLKSCGLFFKKGFLVGKGQLVLIPKGCTDFYMHTRCANRAAPDGGAGFFVPLAGFFLRVADVVRRHLIWSFGYVYHANFQQEQMQNI